ncbi:MAG: DegT/DnrJ/EryC1/StrS family aminotransferase, partial [Bacteroidaceae bacterium]|nr:DegT/DnrJ/EryC1/StrS family aminotransferase [Bacteroidaceae bacterium]
MIPFLSLKDVTALYEAEINEAVARVVHSGWYLQGPENEAFEKNYSQFIGTGKENFGITKRGLNRQMIKGLATVKKAAAKANA